VLHHGGTEKGTRRPGLDHRQIDAAVFEAVPRQAIARHLLDPVPDLNGDSERPDAGLVIWFSGYKPWRAFLICDLKKHYLMFWLGMSATHAHRCFFVNAGIGRA
jgi:hypothetical protein